MRTIADLKSRWPKKAYIIHEDKVVEVEVGKRVSRGGGGAAITRIDVFIVKGKKLTTRELAGSLYLKRESAEAELVKSLDARIKSVLGDIWSQEAELHALLVKKGEAVA